jgi:RNA 3'-terminal phosphate cyclase
MLHYRGCANFRQRIVAATLSGKTLKISEIRQDDESPGLQDFEANFLRLIESMSDGKDPGKTGTVLYLSVTVAQAVTLRSTKRVPAYDTSPDC